MNQNEFMVNPHLEGDDFFWKGNPTGILLIHGFTATTAEVRLMAEKLHKNGYTTAAPLLPGHGTDPHDLNRSTWQMWLEKVKDFYERLARECERVFIIGESMGALLALELTAQHPEINGLILFSPAFGVKKLWLSRFIYPFKFAFEKPKADDGLAWKGYNVYPLRAAAEMYDLQQHTKNQLSKIEQPILLFTGEYDNHISPTAVDIIIDEVKSEIKHHIHLKKSPHVILLAGELGKAYENVNKFMNEYS